MKIKLIFTVPICVSLKASLSADELVDPLLLKQHFTHQQHMYLKSPGLESIISCLCFVALVAKLFVHDAMKPELEQIRV